MACAFCRHKMFHTSIMFSAVALAVVVFLSGVALAAPDSSSVGNSFGKLYDCVNFFDLAYDVNTVSSGTGSRYLDVITTNANPVDYILFHVQLSSPTGASVTPRHVFLNGSECEYRGQGKGWSEYRLKFSKPTVISDIHIKIDYPIDNFTREAALTYIVGGFNNQLFASSGTFYYSAPFKPDAAGYPKFKSVSWAPLGTTLIYTRERFGYDAGNLSSCYLDFSAPTSSADFVTFVYYSLPVGISNGGYVAGIPDNPDDAYLFLPSGISDSPGLMYYHPSNPKIRVDLPLVGFQCSSDVRSPRSDLWCTTATFDCRGVDLKSISHFYFSFLVDCNSQDGGPVLLDRVIFTTSPSSSIDPNIEANRGFLSQLIGFLGSAFDDLKSAILSDSTDPTLSSEGQVIEDQADQIDKVQSDNRADIESGTNDVISSVSNGVGRFRSGFAFISRVCNQVMDISPAGLKTVISLAAALGILFFVVNATPHISRIVKNRKSDRGG